MAENGDVLKGLQPSGIGGLFSQSLRIYGRYFLKLIILFAIVEVPMIILSALLLGGAIYLFSEISLFGGYFFSLSPSETYAILALGGGTLCLSIAHVFLSQLPALAISLAVANDYFGRPVKMIDLLTQMGRRWKQILTLWGGELVVILLLSLGFLVLCVGWVPSIGMYLVAIYCIYPLAVPVVMLERRGGFAALQRAWELLRLRFWETLGIALLIGLLLPQLLMVPGGLINNALAYGLSTELIGADYLTMIQIGVQMVNYGLVSVLVTPWTMVMMTLIYLNLRAQSENPAVQAQRVEKQAVDPVGMLAVTATPPSKSGLFTWKNAGVIVVLAMLGGISIVVAGYVMVMLVFLIVFLLVPFI